MFQNTTSLPLNEGQKEAAEGFFNFLQDDTQKELNIAGPGGVGKTFTMAHMIDEIMPRYHKHCTEAGERPLYDEVVMAATTNKASEVLARATGRPTSTVHSYLGLTVKNNYSTGKADLIKSKSWNVKRNKVIFVDEASMIDSRLRELILEGTHQSKLVYVGDHDQLLPVMETTSPVYESGIPTHFLTQQMRTDKPELKALHQQMRDTIEGKTGFLPIKIIPGIIDWVDSVEMEALVNSHFGEPTDSRIVAYTNNQVINYNNYVREINGYSGEYSVGEELVSNSALQIGAGDRLSIEQELKIIDQDSSTETIRIQGNIDLVVRDTTLDLGYGGILQLKVPVDSDYFLRLVEWFRKEKNWERMYHLKETYPDLRARHACTVHKSQGSSYDTIFIDAADLSTCRQPDVVARLLYVAASRARHRIVFYGDLSTKFGGLVR